VLSVTDTGIGIAPDQLDRIFEEHVRIASPGRRSPPGLGLGLAMVSRIAHLLNAQITAYSDGSRGSRFELVFPSDCVASDTAARTGPLGLAQQASTSDHAVREPAADRSLNSLTAPRALLVDDDAEVAAALQSLLEARGWQTDLASNANEAFARISSSDCWQLLIADCRMGSENDGLALVLATRLVRPDLRCVLISADTSATLQRRVSDHGLILIHKPVSEQALFAEIQIQSALLRQAPTHR
jgi:CheY-like chemotaxis protein